METRKNTRITVTLLLLVIVTLVPIATVTSFRDGLYYPYLTISTASTVDTAFIFNGRPTASSCERLLNNVSHSIQAACPSCTIVTTECLDSLEPAQRRILSTDPLNVPSSRLPDGVVVYRSSQPDIALSACLESERQATNGRHAIVKCFAPSVVRPFTASQPRLENSSYFSAAWFAVVSGAICWLVCLLLVRYQRFHGHLSLDAIEGGPQKFHAVATPRIGGLAILIAVLFTGAGVVPLGVKFSAEDYGCFILAALPAFAGGFAEDITKKIGVLPRLACTMAAAALCAWLLAAVLRRLDIPMLDSALVWTPFAVAFTIFAVGGVANAINIVDGYNGLVAGYSIFVLAAIAWVAAQLGDMFILTAALSMAGALLGFLAWNYPKGRIFLGDGGAYFLGFWLAELSVLLVARHPSVSPWFPLLLLLYPVFETLFSIYRRIRYRGRSPGNADALHFHQLVYLRLVRCGLATREPRMLTLRNSSVAVYIWAGTGCVIALSTFFWRNTAMLIALSVGFCFAYLWLYGRVVRLRAPRWLIRTLHAPKNSSDMSPQLERVIK